MIAGLEGDRQYFGTILSEAESFQVKYDDEWLSDEDKEELL